MQQRKQERLQLVDFLQIHLLQAKLALAEHILPDFTSISIVASLFRPRWCGLPQENNVQINGFFFMLHNPHSSLAPSLNLAVVVCVPVVRGKEEVLR